MIRILPIHDIFIKKPFCHRLLFFGNCIFLIFTLLLAEAESDDTELAGDSAGLAWWSLQPLRRVELPLASQGAKNPIDYFIFQRLKENGLNPSLESDRPTLIRRLFFDLVGLPPSQNEIDAFVSDHSDRAYVDLVDRLLASPHYGERWGRHWLDAVHFGESNGFEYNQPRENAWHYRNWVIKAFNEDMAYDRFVRLQLAGDVMEPDHEGIVATGFLVTGPHNTTKPSNESMRRTMRQDEMEDMIALVGQTFLGLTINCARCHDHKFDPISMVDYYGLASSLAGVEFGDRDIKKTTPAKFNSDGVKSGAESSSTKGDPFKVWAVTSINPGVTHVLKRGNVENKGEVVSPRGISALRMLKSDFKLKPDSDERQRRSKLADWISDEENPLLARVMVNRIWKHHFGQGIVSTPNDFGYSGGRPSHPDLLEWLSGYFKNHGWRLKQLHRLMVTSATYRQQSTLNAQGATLDAGNRLLWRKSPFRMEGEILRDTLLAVSGLLDTKIGGQGYRDMRAYQFKGSNFYDIIPQEHPKQFRRTIYRFSPRGAMRTLLDTFDCPDPSAITPQRAVTTTPLQSLALMNNDFVVSMSRAFARRLERQAGGDIEKQISLAYWLAYGRDTDLKEIEVSEPFIHKYGLAAWCRVIFNSNELLYVR
jgi:hypothetical protein